MTVIEKKPIQLSAYNPPEFFISTVHLTFELDVKETVVHSKIHFEKNPIYSKKCSLKLNGRNLKLIELLIDDRKLHQDEYAISDSILEIFSVPDAFVLQTSCLISPEKNTELYGVYQSNGFICSHNEPEGFRNITYFLDRPDVMAKFTTTLIGSEKEFPVLLSNGNLIEKKQLPNEKHSATWEDPFKKPCYLFALVAGKLDSIHDTYITKSEKKIDLAFYTEPGKKERARFGMECLKNAMRFDEEVFGLEYDLSCYMIVAVDFFNMGAMENKGLNIFNTTTCFADPLTATDDNFLRVETVIGHEYFHNWSGNRIGVRDWFQLTLKEGLTVFRDQEFTSYLHDRAVKRIEDVVKLRARQFPEDQGPTAHPIQPKEYIEINNFYTPTIYDKGAEVVRMLKTLLGDETFFKGVSIFFQRYDGIAATIENWIEAMESASLKDLKQFTRWYHQYGTPVVEVDYEYDEKEKKLVMNVSQSAHPNHSSLTYLPYHFPLKVGLIDLKGNPLHFFIKGARKENDSVILEIKELEETFVFEEVSQECVPSINRNFSAPIILNVDMSFHDYAHLACYDKDPFNQYESFQKLAVQLLQEQVVQYEANNQMSCDSRFLALFGKILKHEHLSYAMKAKILKLPDENEIALSQDTISAQGNTIARKFFIQEIAKVFEKELKELYAKLSSSGQYIFSSEEIGKRRLKNLCLSYLASLETREEITLVKKQFDEAKHMTDQFAALEALSNIHCPEKTEALEQFYDRFKSDSLTLIKWVAVQAASKLPDTLESLKKLVHSKGFEPKMPNHIRALYMTLAENTSVFHDPSGEGYEFYFQALQAVDQFNPQTAALMAQSLKRIHQLSSTQKKTFKKSLEQLLGRYELSSNVLEILTKIKASC
jgi:aminopeptidase N